MNSSDDKNSSDEFESMNQEILKNIQISSQENMLIRSLEKFYMKEENVNIMLPIINGESKISMRLIDFFVTNYAKFNRISYNLEENGSNTLFNVYLSYKSQLKAFNKRYFDPFSRGNRIPFMLPNDCIITTIGQLNFFKWFISKKIYDYVYKNLAKIENDLNITKSTSKNIVKRKKVKKKPQTYKYNNTKNTFTNQTLNMDDGNKNINIVVTFD